MSEMYIFTLWLDKQNLHIASLLPELQSSSYANYLLRKGIDLNVFIFSKTVFLFKICKSFG